MCSLYGKAIWPDFRQYMQSAKDGILQDVESISVEDLLARLKNAIKTGISKYVLSKRIGCKKSLPWINKSITKLMLKTVVF